MKYIMILLKLDHSSNRTTFFIVSNGLALNKKLNTLWLLIGTFAALRRFATFAEEKLAWIKRNGLKELKMLNKNYKTVFVPENNVEKIKYSKNKKLNALAQPVKLN